MASTRQHFVWGWGRLPRAHSESASSPHYAELIPAALPASSPLPASSSFPSSLAPLPRLLPRLLEALETSTSLRSISAAQQHVAAVTNSGEMYSWGTIGPAVTDEDEDGEQIKHAQHAGDAASTKSRLPRDGAALRFRPVWGMEDRGVYHLSLAHDSMFAITATNDVFGWRWADEPPSPPSSSPSSSPSSPPSPSLIPSRSLLPHPLPALSSLSCTSIACGSNFSLFLTSSGTLYSLGSPSHGRLALCSPPTSPVSSLTLVPLGSLVLTRIAAGFTHAAAVTHTGQLLTWGCGLHGRLGNGRSEGDDQLVPLPVSRELDTPVIDVSCGYAHTLALDVEGRVWSFGSNAHGQCGWGEDGDGDAETEREGGGEAADASTISSASSSSISASFSASGSSSSHPVCIESLTEQVVSISCGAFHSACITAVSELFVWGWNRHGQLGLGREESSAPSPVCVSALSGMDVRLVSCAADYTVAVTDHFMSIEPNYFSSSQLAASSTASLSASLSNGELHLHDREGDSDSLPSSASASSVISVRPPVLSSPSSSATAADDRPAPVVFEEGSGSPAMSGTAGTAAAGQGGQVDSEGRKRSASGVGTGRRSSGLSPTADGGGGADLRTLLSLVKEALLITPLPDNFPSELASELPQLWSASNLGSESTVGAAALPSSSSSSSSLSPPSRPRASTESKQRQQLSAFNKMSRAYLSKLHRSAREAAAVRVEEERRRAREERQAAEATKRNAKRERAMEEAANEWVKQLLPRWGEPKVRQRARELVMRVGIPTKVRGQVWPVCIGNALSINAELYRIVGERANRFKQHNRRRQQQLTTITLAAQPDQAEPPEAAETTDSSSASSSSSSALSSSSSSDGGLSDLRAFGKEHTFSYIDTDLARTFPSLAFFQEECAMHDQLRSVLWNYCFYRPDIGYVQGMSFLAAYLLLYMPPYKSFICLANLLNSAFFHAFLKMDAQLLALRYAFFSDLLHDAAPALSFHLLSQGVAPELYLLEWSITLFAKRLKLDVVGRVWDLYIMDGEAAVYRVGCAVLLLLNAGHALEKEDLGGILKRLSKDGHEIDEERLMAEVSRLQLSDKMTQRLQQIINAHSKDDDAAVV